MSVFLRRYAFSYLEHFTTVQYNTTTCARLQQYIHWVVWRSCLLSFDLEMSLSLAVQRSFALIPTLTYIFTIHEGNSINFTNFLATVLYPGFIGYIVITVITCRLVVEISVDHRPSFQSISISFYTVKNSRSILRDTRVRSWAAVNLYKVNLQDVMEWEACAC